MLIDENLPRDLHGIAARAADLETAGFDGLWLGETRHDPFLRMLDAARATERVTLATSVAIAFARTPMTTAQSAYDLAACARGRFVLGLGSQVKPHVERRYSMPWSHPAARMREYVLALRAIWACWHDGVPLEFRGEYYTHTLMPPFFCPPRHEYGPPPVYLAGVGAYITEVAGEVADGFFVHPFTTPRYFDEVTVPALARGRGRGAAEAAPLAICGLPFVAIGRNDDELARAITGTKRQIAFYASTAAYRPVLDLHGLGELQPLLTRMTRENRWDDMAACVDDDLLHLLAVVGDPETVARGVVDRWGASFSRLALYVNYDLDPQARDETVAAIRRLLRR